MPGQKRKRKSESPPKEDKAERKKRKKQADKDQAIKARQRMHEIQEDLDNNDQIDKLGSGALKKLMDKQLEAHDMINAKSLQHIGAARASFELHRQTSGILWATCKVLKSSSHAWDEEEIIQGVKRFQEGEDGEIDWAKIGQIANAIFHGIPSCNFMNGALNPELKQKDKKKGVRLIKQRAEVTRPEDGQKKANELEKSETNQRNKDFVEQLRKQPGGKARLLEYLQHPQSYGQTIENYFDLSFCAKQGYVAIDTSGPEPMLGLINPDKMLDDDDWAEGKDVGTQCVMKIDYSLWRNTSRALGHDQDTQPIIPDRSQLEAYTQAQ